MEPISGDTESPMRIYHATPLQRLEEIFLCGELRSQSLLGYSRGRVSARKRDRQLGVDCFVHCSLSPTTPLLNHKLCLGYSHVVLQFDLPSTEQENISVLPMNTKAWRSKWQCQPVSDSADRDRLLRLYREGRRYRSLEVLIHQSLSLIHLTAVLAPSSVEMQFVTTVLDRSNCAAVPVLRKDLRPQDYRPKFLPELRERFKSGDSRLDAASRQLPFD